jgi:hypothetical protein
MCINQATSDTKARGIDQIGKFLRNSEELLILWSPDYFSRLWCCFEIAMYLHFLRPGDDHLIPPGDGERGALKKLSSFHAAQHQRKIVLVPLSLAMSGLLIAGNLAQF